MNEKTFKIIKMIFLCFEFIIKRFIVINENGSKYNFFDYGKKFCKMIHILTKFSLI